MILTPPLAQKFGHEPAVGIDQAGDAVVVGLQLDGVISSLPLQVTTQPAAGGDWSRPVTLSKPGTSAGSATLVVDRLGDVSVVWNSFTASKSVAVVATGVLPQGNWAESAALSNPGTSVGYPVISINPAGDAVTTWTVMDTSSGAPNQLQASERRGPNGHGHIPKPSAPQRSFPTRSSGSTPEVAR